MIDLIEVLKLSFFSIFFFNMLKFFSPKLSDLVPETSLTQLLLARKR